MTSSRQQIRLINRVISKSQTGAKNDEEIMKTFMNFDKWTKNHLNKLSLKLRNDLPASNSFDTNFNAEMMSARRIERNLHLKLGNVADELEKVYYKGVD